MDDALCDVIGCLKYDTTTQAQLLADWICRATSFSRRPIAGRLGTRHPSNTPFRRRMDGLTVAHSVGAEELSSVALGTRLALLERLFTAAPANTRPSSTINTSRDTAHR